jgi:hypothetical protein
MKRASLFFLVPVLCVVTAAVVLRGQEAPAIRGAGAPKQQLELEAATPKLQIAEEVLPLTVPGHTIGETEGVSRNSKGHLFVYSRTGPAAAPGRHGRGALRVRRELKFVKLWGPGNYAASFAHVVRVDKYDNVWMVDEGSNMIVKFDPNAMVKMVLGRKPEAIDYLEKYLERGEKDTERVPPAGVGTFNRQTDLAWDAQDNIFVADGYNNSRVVKLGKDGSWIKTVGTRGAGANQFNTVHGIAVDAQQGLVYVADRGNFRIQVYDTDLNFKKTITGVRRAVVRAGHRQVHLQRRWERQALSAGQEHGEAAWLGADQPGPWADRLPDPFDPRAVGQRPLQGLLHVVGTWRRSPSSSGRRSV